MTSTNSRRMHGEKVGKRGVSSPATSRKIRIRWKWPDDNRRRSSAAVDDERCAGKVTVTTTVAFSCKEEETRTKSGVKERAREEEQRTVDELVGFSPWKMNGDEGVGGQNFQSTGLSSTSCQTGHHWYHRTQRRTEHTRAVTVLDVD